MSESTPNKHLMRIAERAAAASADMPVCAECGEVWIEAGQAYREAWRQGTVALVRHRVMCSHQLAEAAAREAARTEEEGRWKHKMARQAAESFYREMPAPAAYWGRRLAEVDERSCSIAGRHAAERYLETWPERLAEGHGMIFSGDIGTGKSLLAAVIANEVCANRFARVQFTTVTNLQNRLREFSDSSETMGRLKRADLVVLDDFGQERATEWAASQLFDLVDARCQNKRPTIFTTNLGAAALAAHYVRSLTHGRDQMPEEQARVTVDRILSRMRQLNVTVQFKGKDQRAAAASSWLEGDA